MSKSLEIFYFPQNILSRVKIIQIYICLVLFIVIWIIFCIYKHIIFKYLYQVSCTKINK